MLQVSRLFIYPVKSLGGIEVQSAEVTDRGFKHDRRWMLIDANNRFLSQRENALMALFKVSVEVDGIKVIYKDSSITIPFEPGTTEGVLASVWDDTCAAIRVGDRYDQWFTDHLGINCRLIYMPDHTYRKVDEKYAHDGEITSFSDAYPFMTIGQASLDELNQRLNADLKIDRFRPNIVFTGGTPFQEDEMRHFIIGDIHFYGVKPCARCVVITIDQQTAQKGAEPTRTLASYRRRNNNVYFGQNLLHHGKGVISVGDTMHLINPA